MKRYLCPGLLLVLAVVAALPSRFLGFTAIMLNCLPPVALSIFLLFGRRRWAALADIKSALLGLLYGLLAGVAAAAFAVRFFAIAFADDVARYPCDSAAGAILMALFSLLLLGVAIFDFFKNEMKPFWLRLVTA